MNRFRLAGLFGRRCLRPCLTGLLGLAVLAPPVPGQVANPGICGRTEAVREELLAEVQFATSNDSLTCAQVTAAHLADIAVLALSSKGISTLAAGDFAGLSALTNLDLYGNSLRTLPAGIFSGLTGLQTLSLEKNSLSRLPAGVFAGLSSLRELHLANNNLRVLDGTVFNALPSLTVLTLNGNRLPRLPATVFSGLSALQTLHLYGNRLTAVGTQFQNLGSLQRLTLHENSIRTVAANAFTGLSSLRVLNLYDNEFSSLPAGAFSGLTALEQLDLGENSLSTLPAGLFSGLNALQILLLSYNDLTSLPTGVFAGLTSLRQLHLEFNELTSLPPDPFAGLTALENLYLNHNRLTGLPGNLFRSLVNLKRLHLNANPHFPSNRLPDDFLVGPTNLTELDLRCDNNTDSAALCTRPPLPIPLQLEITEAGSDMATARLRVPTGAPFPMSAALLVNKRRVGILRVSGGSTRGAPFSFVVPSRGACETWVQARTPSLNTLAFRGIRLESSNRHHFGDTGSALALPEVSNREAPVGQALSIELPASTGGGCDDHQVQVGATNAVTYSLEATTSDGTLVVQQPTGVLPAGLEFAADTRTLSGTPTAAGTYSMTFRVIDADGNSATETFELRLQSSDPAPSNPPLAINTAGNLSYSVHEAIESLILPEAIGGTGDLAYRMYATTSDGALNFAGLHVLPLWLQPFISIVPAGLEFDADTRTLSGTPTAAGTYKMVYKVTDETGASATSRFTLHVYHPLLWDYSPADQLVTDKYRDRRFLLPVAVSPNGYEESARYSLVAKTADGVLHNGLPAGMRFTPPPPPPPRNGAGNIIIISAASRPVAELRGIPSAIGSYFLTYKATGVSGNSVTATFELIVEYPLRWRSRPGKQEYTVGQAIELELTEARSEYRRITVPVAYGLEATTSDGTLAGNLPAGLSFVAETRTLSGTPTAPGTYHMTYWARNAGLIGGGVTATFKLIVHGPLSWDAVPEDRVYLADRPIDEWVLPPATGVGALTYSLETTTSDGALNGALPAGLEFAADTRALSGTPTAEGSYSMTYRVTDTRGKSIAEEFELAVAPALLLNSAPGARSYLAGRAIDQLVLPQGAGGIGTLTYGLEATTDNGTLDGDLPAGLEFDADTRTLSGTPTAAGTYSMAYSVTDANLNSTPATFELVVRPALAWDALPEDRNWLAGRPIGELELPQASGGSGALTYRLEARTSNGEVTDGLPAGLEFATDTRILSGTPTAEGSYLLTYRVADEDSSSLAEEFELLVAPALLLSAPSAQTWLAGRAVDELVLPEATGGIGALRYELEATTDDGALNSHLPAGLEFAADTRTLSGTPTAAGTYRMTFSAIDARNNSTPATFELVVRPALAWDSAPEDRQYLADRAIDELELPQASGGIGALTWSLEATTEDGTLDGALPAGLEFDATTRTLSGTPTAAGSYLLTYSATDTRGNSLTTEFELSVAAALLLPAPDAQTWLAGRAVELELPQATGGIGALSYGLEATTDDGALNSHLPAGLEFAASTRTLSGTPTAAGTYSMAYSATDTRGNITPAAFELIIRPALSWDEVPEDREYTAGLPIGELELPTATGGIGTLTYRLETSTSDGRLNGDLPAGLSFAADTRLSGTPTAAGSYELIWRAIDSRGNVIATEIELFIRPAPALVLASSPPDREYLVDTAMALVLPQATGGIGNPSYSLEATTDDGMLDGDLPAGLDFVAETRTLSGTPTAAGTYRMTWAADTEDDSLTAEFDLVVKPPLALSSPGQQAYLVKKTIEPLALPQATGGLGTVRYSLVADSSSSPLADGLPVGLEFDADTRTLSGTPLLADRYGMTYSATDEAGTQVEVHFDLHVYLPLQWASPLDDRRYLVGQAVSLKLPRTIHGFGSRTYSLQARTSDGALKANLPAGLNFAANTRILSGTPTAPGSYLLIYSAADGDGNILTTHFNLKVHPALSLASPTVEPHLVGADIDLELPQGAGGIGALTYSLTATTSDGTLVNGLPAGLNFAAGTRTLSGTPTAAGTYRLRYSAEDKGGNSVQAAEVALVIHPALSLATPSTRQYLVGADVDLELPQATGGIGALTYRLTATTSNGNLADELPAGLEFAAATRTLSGTPTAAGTYRLTYRATDTRGNWAEAEFRLVVYRALSLTSSTARQYLVGADVDLELPEASGGFGARTYSLEATTDNGTVVNKLPAGLRFVAAARTLSGTPTVAGTYSLTYGVADEDNNRVDATFTLVVYGALSLTSPTVEPYVVSADIDLELPAATGGFGARTYSLEATTDNGMLVNQLPAGLEFAAGTRTLSGTPTAAGSYSLTYSVADEDDNRVETEFALAVYPALSLASPTVEPYLVGADVDLELPQGAGGIGALTHSLTATTSDGMLANELPAGLSFAADTRTLSGTPTAAGSYRLRYSAEDEDGNSVQAAEVALVIHPALSLATPSAQQYLVGADVDLELPAAAGGIGALTYRLTATITDGNLADELPAGLEFAAATRTLSGTPTTADTYRLTYRATDTRGNWVEAEFRLVVYQALSLASPAAQQYLFGATVNLELPAASGGFGARTYSLTATSSDGKVVNQLPAGLRFVAATRTLSGTPTAAGTYSLTYSVADEDNNSADAGFTLVVYSALSLASPAAQQYLVGTTVDLELPAASGGFGARTYSLTATTANGTVVNQLPAGLEFTAGTRTLSGTPTAAGNYSLTYSVADEDGNSVDAGFTLVVYSALSLASPAAQQYPVGADVDLELPAAIGGFGARTYSLEATTDNGTVVNQLPAGLNFVATTRTLSGTPTTAGRYSLTLRATDSRGNEVEAGFTLAVYPVLSLASPTVEPYLVGADVELELPAAIGGFGARTYSLTATSSDGTVVNQLPASLRFVAATRTLSGTPTAAGTYSLIWSVADEDGNSVEAGFTLVVYSALSLASPTAQQYLVGNTVALELPEASGGFGARTYSLEATTDNGTVVNKLPAGLNFAAGTRRLSGAPTAAGTYSLTYSVADEDGNSVDAGFTLVVYSALSLASPAAQQYLVGADIDLELPAATGGFGARIYSLKATTSDGELPAGLVFAAGSRKLSGAPTAAGTYSLTWSVADEDDNRVETEFRLVVHPVLSLVSATVEPHVVGADINLELPQAAGGIGALAYYLTATTSDGTVDGGLPAGSGGAVHGELPAGLNFDAATRRLSGTPTAAGTYRLTWRATDTRGNRVETEFRLVVYLALSLASPAVEPYVVGADVDLELPQAAGGLGALTYRLTATTSDGVLVGGLPAGLRFAADTRMLSGSPTAAGRYSLRYSAEDEDGNSAQAAEVALVVHPALSLASLPGRDYLSGREIPQLDLPQATGGIGDRTYSLTATTSNGTLDGGLPAGLGFDDGTRALSGIPTAAGRYSMAYRATDSRGNSVEQGFALVVHSALSLNSLPERDYLVGARIAELELPVAAGGIGVLTYGLGATTSDGTLEGGLPGGLGPFPGPFAPPGNPSALAGALPAGLEFAAGSRTLSGTPTAAGTYSMTYRVRDTRDNAVEQGFRLVVHPARTLAPLPARTWLAGKEIVALELPEATGGLGTPIYSLKATTSDGVLVDELPAGLEFDAASRTLSGTPTAAGRYRMIWSVVGVGNNRAEETFELVVRPTLLWASAPTGGEYLAGKEIAALVLPQASGGIGALTYALAATTSEGALDGALPAGLSFAAATRTLSGTPTVAGRYSMSFSVTDEDNNSVEETFELVVHPALYLVPLPDRNLVMGVEIAQLVLPQATGGIGELTYSLRASTADGALDGELPAGLEFAADSRTLSGAPTATGTYRLIWRATDSEQNSVSLSFRMLVVADESPTFAAEAQLQDQTWLTYTPIDALVLPAAAGGNGALVYSLRATTEGGTLVGGLPAGLRFDPSTRRLSGTPTAAGRYRMTYSATDTDGDRAVLQFSVQTLMAEQVAAMADGEIRQSSALALAASVGQSMVHRLETFAAGDLFASSVNPDGSALSLPLAVTGGDEQESGLAFWLQGSQQQLENRHGVLAWDGEVEETRLGLDGKVGSNLLVGLMMSRSEGIFDYDGVGGALHGRYQSELELVGPYLGWVGDGGLNIWAMLSSGEGWIGAPDADGEQFDVSMGLLGLDYQLLSGRVTDFRVRAELSSLDLEYGSADRSDNADVLGEAAMVSETWQLRLVAETSHRFRTAGGASWTPSWQLAFRDSNNAQGLSTGTEFGGSLGYRSANSLLTVEVGARVLDAESEGYKESGSYLLLRMQTSSDRRGLSFSLSPKRGQTASRVEDLWDRRPDTLLTHSLASAEDANDAEQMVGELGYGIAWGARFLLTPYGKFGWSDGHRNWALGTRWQTGQHFSLSLEGHGQASGQSDPTHGIRLEGRLNF